MNNSPEIEFLRDETIKRFGGRVKTSKDYEALSASIQASVGESVSTSTLKRFYGYMTIKPQPRSSTLDVLSKYIGRASYRDLCRELQESSGFLSVEALRATDIEPGGLILLRWMPDREVKLVHMDGLRFKVVDSGKSKLREGDEFEVLEFIKGHPLYIPGITRDGGRLPEYVAGRTAGLTAIEVTRGLSSR